MANFRCVWKMLTKRYVAGLSWMFFEHYERLSKVCVLEKTQQVFFFSEAHLLFNAAPTLDKIEQVICLTRSQGTVYRACEEILKPVISKAGGR